MKTNKLKMIMTIFFTIFILCILSLTVNKNNEIFKTIHNIIASPLSYPLLENEYVRNRNIRKIRGRRKKIYYLYFDRFRI